MITSDLYQEIVGGLTSNKVRTGLTMLGIVIGIASVVTMVAIGQGSTQDIQIELNHLVLIY